MTIEPGAIARPTLSTVLIADCGRMTVLGWSMRPKNLFVMSAVVEILRSAASTK